MCPEYNLKTKSISFAWSSNRASIREPCALKNIVAKEDLKLEGQMLHELRKDKSMVGAQKRFRNFFLAGIFYIPAKLEELIIYDNPLHVKWKPL